MLLNDLATPFSIDSMAPLGLGAWCFAQRRLKNLDGPHSRSVGVHIETVNSAIKRSEAPVSDPAFMGRFEDAPDRRSALRWRCHAPVQSPRRFLPGLQADTASPHGPSEGKLAQGVDAGAACFATWLANRTPINTKPESATAFHSVQTRPVRMLSATHIRMDPIPTRT